MTKIITKVKFLVEAVVPQIVLNHAAFIVVLSCREYYCHFFSDDGDCRTEHVFAGMHKQTTMTARYCAAGIRTYFGLYT